MKTIEEVARLEPDEYDIYLEAYELRKADQQESIHMQAWANQQVKATKGKSGKPYYKKFKDFYNIEKMEKKIHKNHDDVVKSQRQKNDSAIVSKFNELYQEKMQEIKDREGGK